MESTGVYWIPLFGVLEERGFKVMLVDPQPHQERARPQDGRAGLSVAAAVAHLRVAVGKPSGRRVRYAACAVTCASEPLLVEYASQHVQHIQKALTQMNVKLQHVISDITGKTGMDIIEAIVGGERSPRRLAQLRDPRTKADEKTIAKSLRGHWRQEHIFELTQRWSFTGPIRTRLPSATGKSKPSWSGLKTVATASLRLPMARSAIRKTRPASMFRASCTG